MSSRLMEEDIKELNSYVKLRKTGGLFPEGIEIAKIWRRLQVAPMADFLAGAPFQLLYDGVKLALKNTKSFKTQLRKLESTLTILQPAVVEQLRVDKVQLSLPTQFIEELQRKMNEGVDLLHELSSLSNFNVNIWASCVRPRYAEELEELNTQLQDLLGILEFENMALLGQVAISSKSTVETMDEIRKCVSEVRRNNKGLSDKVGDLEKLVHSNQKGLSDRLGDLEKVVFGNQQKFNDGHCNLEAKERVESVVSGSEVSVSKGRSWKSQGGVWEMYIQHHQPQRTTPPMTSS